MRGNRDQTTTHSRWPYSSGWNEAGGWRETLAIRMKAWRLGRESWEAGGGRREKRESAGRRAIPVGGEDGGDRAGGRDTLRIVYLYSGQRSNQRRRRGQSLPQRDEIDRLVDFAVWATGQPVGQLANPRGTWRGGAESALAEHLSQQPIASDAKRAIDPVVFTLAIASLPLCVYSVRSLCSHATQTPSPAHPEPLQRPLRPGPCMSPPLPGAPRRFPGSPL